MKNRIWKQMEHVVMAALFLIWAFCAGPVRAAQKGEPALTPFLTETPQPTGALPEPTAKPGATAEPELTPEPEPTVVPEPTPIPEPTSVPEPTAIPEPTPQELFPALSLELQTDSEILKAGAEVLYQVKILNEGNVTLEHISLESRFSCPKIKVDWEAAQGLVRETQEEGQTSGRETAILERLEPGEERTLYLHAVLTEEQSQRLAHRVTARVISPGPGQETILEEAALETEVEPLKIDFTVEKTADRAIAVPGDVITYWICIRNTGERTLHSVASTERFLGSDIQARFEEQEGIILNGAGTQALISRILPGDAVNLKASVLVPETAGGQELINEVTVRTEETGEHSVSAQSSVIVGVLEPEITGKAELLQASDGKENPKTKDASPTGIFAGLMCASMAASGLLGAWRKAKRRR